MQELYNRRLDRLEEEEETDRARAQIGLQFLLVSNGSMDLTELGEIMTIHLSDAPGSNADLVFNPRRRLRLDDVEEIMGVFAWVLPDTQRIGLSHTSVREFLLSQTPRHAAFRLRLEETHALAAKAYLVYIHQIFEAQSELPSLTNADDWAVLTRDHPLLQCAAMNWPRHVVLSNHESQLQSQIRKFFSHDTGYLQAWVSLLRVVTDPSFYMPGRSAPRLSLLYHAVSHGLMDTVNWLLERGEDPNEVGGSYGGTILHAAAWTRRPRIAQTLLEHGANRETVDEFDRTAFDLALVQRDHETLYVMAKMGQIPATSGCYFLTLHMPRNPQKPGPNTSTGSYFGARPGSAALESDHSVTFWACCSCRCTNSATATSCKSCKAACCGNCVWREFITELGTTRPWYATLLESIQAGLIAPPPLLGEIFPTCPPNLRPPKIAPGQDQGIESGDRRGPRRRGLWRLGRRRRYSSSSDEDISGLLGSRFTLSDISFPRGGPDLANLGLD